MMRWIPIVPALLLSVCGVRAAEREVRLTPLLGLRGGATLDPSSPQEGWAEADPSASIGLGLDVRLRPDARVEIFFDRQELDFEPKAGQPGSGFDLTIDYLHAGGVYEPPRKGTRGFVAAGLGLTRFDADGASVTDALGLSGSLAGGATVPFGERLTLRLELRGYATLSDVALEASCGPGCVVNLSGGGWYQLAARVGLAIRL